MLKACDGDMKLLDFGPARRIAGDVDESGALGVGGEQLSAFGLEDVVIMALD